MAHPAAATGPGPILLAGAPAAIDQNGTSSGPGATARPVRSADQPQTSWHQRVTISSIAPNAVPNTTFAAVAVENAGSLSRCGSMTGAGCRADRRMNSASRTAATAIEPSTRADVQPHSSDFTRARASAPIAIVNSAAPTVSGRTVSAVSALARFLLLSARGSTRRLASSATAAIGTFTRKTQRQFAATSAPPSTGPSAAAAPPTEVQPRIAPVRLSG